MKLKVLFVAIFCSFLFVSCKDKSKEAATLICECNKDLVTYNKKMKALQEANDVNSIAEMQEKGNKLTEKAQKCMEKMEKTIGRKLMDSKEFEVSVMPLLKKECPEVHKAYEAVAE